MFGLETLKKLNAVSDNGNTNEDKDILTESVLSKLQNCSRFREEDAEAKEGL